MTPEQHRAEQIHRGRGASTCEGCAWWEIDGRPWPQNGVCAGNRLHHINGTASVEHGKRGAGVLKLVTWEGFGCNQFEPMPIADGDSTPVAGAPTDGPTQPPPVADSIDERKQVLRGLLREIDKARGNPSSNAVHDAYATCEQLVRDVLDGEA